MHDKICSDLCLICFVRFLHYLSKKRLQIFNVEPFCITKTTIPEKWEYANGVDLRQMLLEINIGKIALKKPSWGHLSKAQLLLLNFFFFSSKVIVYITMYYIYNIQHSLYQMTIQTDRQKLLSPSLLSVIKY
jgi:hypothetical protein